MATKQNNYRRFPQYRCNCMVDRSVSGHAGLEDIVLTQTTDTPHPHATATEPDEETCWFVMRDLKRPNAKLPAYRQLADEGHEVFTPLETRIVENGGKRRKVTVPVIRDLLFVHSARNRLDPTVRRTDTLQYRYKKGGTYCEPLIVPRREMEQFMQVVNSGAQVRYYRPDEITPGMLGAAIRILANGPLYGAEGRLRSVRGSKKRRLVVELTGLLAVEVEVQPDFIELI